MTLSPLQEQWLQALESGEYKQGRSFLFTGIAYCCLGVAEVVCGRTLTESGLEGKNNKSGELYLTNSFMLQEDAERLGLLSEVGSLVDRDFLFYAELQKAGYLGELMYSLSAYNDSGVTFQQLAQAIRAYPKTVFKSL